MVIDSHTLTWWLERAPELSGKATDVFEQAPGGRRPLIVSAVTFWEMRMKERRGHFLPKTLVRRWPALLRRVPWMQVVDVTPEIWLLAADLDWTHRDPADRIIAATALLHRVPVLTKDRVFHAEDSPVMAVW
jgi:PIN domain nuclease of toxin-antitoxin system